MVTQHDVETVLDGLSATQKQELLQLVLTRLCSGSINPGAQSLSIPIGIFCGSMHPAEALTFYLKKEGLSYKAIANLLGKNERTIWHNYQRALEHRTTYRKHGPFVPLSLFRTKLSTLEAVVWYLHKMYTLQDISILLNKPYGTIASVYHRAKQKQ